MSDAADTAPVDTDEVANPVGKEEGPDDDAPDAEPASPTVGRRERKPLNPELWRKAAAAARAHVEGAETDDDDVIAPTGPDAAAAAVAPDAEKPPDAPRGPPPEAIAAWERANLRAADLDRRETALKEREGRTRDVAGRFIADPYSALTDLVKADLGDGATEQEISDELAYQVTQMSLALAGATIPADNVSHELKKLKREVNQRKIAERKAAADSEGKRAEADRAERVKNAIVQIGAEFNAMSSKFPWLAAAEDPSDLIYDVIKREHDRSGTVLDIDVAAKLADDYLSEADKNWFKKRSHLLNPTPAPTPAKANVHQGDPPNRRSRTLTNADASEDAATSPERPAVALSAEERRKRTIDKWRSKLKEAEHD